MSAPGGLCYFSMGPSQRLIDLSVAHSRRWPIGILKKRIDRSIAVQIRRLVVPGDNCQPGFQSYEGEAPKWFLRRTDLQKGNGFVACHIGDEHKLVDSVFRRLRRHFHWLSGVVEEGEISSP